MIGHHAWGGDGFWESAICNPHRDRATRTKRREIAGHRWVCNEYRLISFSSRKFIPFTVLSFYLQRIHVLYETGCVASRLGRRPKRLKEMQFAAAVAATARGGVGGSMSVASCASSTDEHLKMPSAAMRRLCMSSAAVNSSLDVTDVHAELQVCPTVTLH